MCRPKLIENPDKFLELFREFKTWKLQQRVQTHQLSRSGDVVDINHTPPLTWASFDAWLFEEKQIIVHTEDYRANKDGRYEEFAGVIRAIGAVMFAQKFEGAAVGKYKENIIARELHLRDGQDVTTGGDRLPGSLNLPPGLTFEQLQQLANEPDPPSSTH